MSRRAPLHLALGLFLFGAAPVWAQISPGPLSQAHASLSGPSHCVDCHDVAKHPPEYKCLECHTEIRQRLDERRGLHPSEVGQDRTGRSCVRCHSDHNGRDFNLIHWDTPVEKFDHHRASYALEGRHAGLACQACHKPEHIADAAALKTRNLQRTFLGLSRNCVSCHADEHRGQFPGQCERCHNPRGWKADLNFDHTSARFQLEGAHARVACEKCHRKSQDAKPYTLYRGLEYEQCSSCHRDPHRGAFRAPCASCHSTRSWVPNQVTSAFDHAKTAFPLKGKHGGLACRSCHAQSDFKQPVAHAQCADCHRKDPHGGQFKHRTDGGACSACHNEEGFKPATFSILDHQRTRFPLEDKHLDVACARCHVPRGVDTVFALGEKNCASCHKDTHEGQFQGPPHLNRCERCHTTKGFQPSTFTLTQHRQTGFALSGSHKAVVCVECHARSSGGSAKYRFPDDGCTACHRDPHQGEFAARTAALRPDGKPAGCESCHNTQNWRDLLKFDHSTTRFALRGIHRGLACEQCHKSTTFKPGLSAAAFRSTPRECSGCHEDVHAGQFSAGQETTDCARCHEVVKWKPSLFDHEKDSTYPLQGAHKQVRCGLCHVRKMELAGRTVLVYRGTPRACAACHGATAFPQQAGRPETGGSTTP